MKMDVMLPNSGGEGPDQVVVASVVSGGEQLTGSAALAQLVWL